jgi:aspartate/methionine/tyrosine aminotransferase
LQGIAEVVDDFPHLVVLSDEVYEHMTFDGKKQVHIARCSGMWERTISLFSVGKTFSCTGWRIGYAIGPASLLDSMKVLHSVINFSTSTPLQKATTLAFGYAEKTNYFQWLSDLLQRKKNCFCDALKKLGKFTGND